MLNPDKIRDIPSHIVNNYLKVNLYIGAMHVNCIIFLVGISKYIGLIQCGCVRKKNCKKFLEATLLMIREYQSRNVVEVISIGVDKSFDAVKYILKDKPYQISLATCNVNQHSKTIERTIRFVKERIRVVRLAMPYTIIPKRCTIKMVNRVIILMNLLPRKGGLHSVLSPREIVTGNKFRRPKIQIGQYVQGLVDGTNNREKERSINALYLGRADNGSGHRVFKLGTKVVVSVNRVMIILTPQTIMGWVDKMGVSEKQPEGIQFTGFDGKITIHDLDLNRADNDDDNSNTSDKGFVHDKGYQKGFDND